MKTYSASDSACSDIMIKKKKKFVLMDLDKVLSHKVTRIRACRWCFRQRERTRKSKGVGRSEISSNSLWLQVLATWGQWRGVWLASVLGSQWEGVARPAGDHGLRSRETESRPVLNQK